jgi:hypothetical protein
MKKTRGLVRAGVGALGWISVVASTATAFAEESAQAPATAPSAPQGSPPDLIRLKNGGMLRGTISELVPNDYVVIVTLSGESKRFSMSDVQYAGPAAEERTYPAPAPVAPAPAPVAPAPAPTRVDDEGDARPEITVHAEEARVSLTSEPSGHTFHKRTSSAVVRAGSAVAVGEGYREMCTAPCEVSIASGTYSFGVSEPGESPVAAEAVTVPPGRSELHATYNDNSGVRIAGGVVLAAGLVGGLGLTLASLDGGSGELDTGLLIASTGVMCGGIVIGFALMRVSDSAEVEVRQAHAEPARHDALSVAGEGRARGVAFSGVF